LLLFVATVVFWARSYGPADLLWWRREGTNYQIESAEGGMVVVKFEVLIHDDSPGEATLPPAHATREGRTARLFTRLLPAEEGWCQTRGGAFVVPRRTVGFQYASVGDGVIRFLRIPYWALVLVTAFLPGLRLAGAFRTPNRRRKGAGGVCARCGYDLRATPDRCPECGTVPPPANPAADGAG
jgi:hypothetical protein